MTSLCGVSPILHRIKKCSYGAYGAKDKPGDIPLPRSLTRCARSFGCGERRGQAYQRRVNERRWRGSRKGHGVAG
ncbi:hypothetical protein EK80_25580, partial [Salmonella enterica]|nr:hypothetical protein [Salmonella enterica]